MPPQGSLRMAAWLATVLVCQVAAVVGVSSEGNSPAQAVADVSDQALDYWHWRNPTTRGNHLRSVMLARDTFWAVGDAGTLISSVDGNDWRDQSFPGTSDLYDLAFTNGVFVIVGEGGLIYRSTNGVVWTRQASPRMRTLFGVTCRGRFFVAVGDRGVVITSKDGRRWHAQNSRTTNALRDVLYAGGLFVAVGDAGTVCTSRDGTNWTRRAQLGGALHTVTRGNGTFVATGNWGLIASSRDGITWTTRSSATTADLYSVHFAEGKFRAFGQGGVMRASGNGVEWSLNYEDGFMPSRNWIFSAVHGKRTYVAVGTDGTRMYSYDARRWSGHYTLEAAVCTSFAFFRGRYVVSVNNAGASQTMYSTNGVDWTNCYSCGPSGNSVGFASNGEVLVSAATWLSASTNGVNWTHYQPAAGHYYEAAAYGAGQFVAVGAWSACAVSANGVDWTELALPGLHHFADICFGDGTFVMVGSDRLWVSRNGREWAFEQVQDTVFSAVAYGNGQFVAVGSGLYPSVARIATSLNGITWELHDPGITNALTCITHAQDHFLTGGEGGALLTSVDGMQWRRRHSGTKQTIRAVGFAEDSFLAVGGGQMVLQSEPLSARAPNFHQPPQNRTVTEGEPLTLTSGVTGTSRITFQWYKNGMSLTGETNADFRVGRAALAQTGAYHVVASNAVGVATSAVAQVTVEPPVCGLSLWIWPDATRENWELTITGNPGPWWRIETTDRLAANTVWKPVFTFRANTNAITIGDTSRVDRAFYRAVLLP